MRSLVVVLAGLALISAQIAHGGITVPFLFVPALVFVALALVVAVAGQFRSAPMPFPQLAAGAVFTGYVLWRCLVAEDHEVARIDAGHWLLCIGAWLAIASVASGRRMPLWVAGTILVCALVEVGFAAFQVAKPGSSDTAFWFSEELRISYAGRFSNRVRGLFMNPNHLAWATNVAALLALGLGIWGRVNLIWRLVLLYLAVTFAGATVFSASRGGLLSLVAGSAVFCALSLWVVLRSGSARRRWLILGGTGGVALVAVGLAVIYSSNWVVQGRVDTLWDSSARKNLFVQAVRSFEQAPLLGVGPGTFVYVGRELRNRGNDSDPVYVHNDWLQFAAEYGYAGTVLWLLLLALVGAGAVRGLLVFSRQAVEKHGQPMSLRVGLLIGAVSAWVACLAHGLSDFNLHVPANALLGAMVMGLLVSHTADSPGRRVAWMSRALATSLLLFVAAAIGGYLWVYGRADFWSLRAANAYQLGRVDDSLSFAGAGLALRPTDPRLNRTLGMANFGYEAALAFQAATGDRELVIDESPPASAGGSLDPRIVSDDRQQNRNELALRSLLIAVENDPRERQHWIDATRVAMDLARFGQAQSLARRAIRLDPVHGVSWENYGDLFYQQDQLRKALAVYLVGASLDGGGNSSVEAEAIQEELEANEESDPR